KREERLQDVPISETVISATTLLEQNSNSLRDYYTSVPGLQLQMGATGGFYANSQNVTIRGLSTGIGQHTVAFVVDDVPWGQVTGDNENNPDLDPSDLERIEVLRGPQGTLYGASSLGGLIKYVTIQPSLAGV